MHAAKKCSLWLHSLNMYSFEQLQLKQTLFPIKCQFKLEPLTRIPRNFEYIKVGQDV